MNVNKNQNKEGLKVAGRQYQTEDYQSQDEVSSGLATTHEQASDTWTEGEIKATIDDTDDGKEIEIPRKGYD
jgi:hypothetical protein